MPDEIETRDERLARHFAEWLTFLQAGIAIAEWPGEVKERGFYHG
jgi:hypothetical protein